MKISLKSLLILLAFGLLLSCGQKKQNDSGTEKQPPVSKTENISVSTSDEAINELKNGNNRFVLNQLINTNYPVQIKNSKEKQKPHSVILSCMDSRIPPEIIFDQGIGNLFVIRNAGNIEDVFVLGSLEYAVKFVGSKLIVVMGHNHCGAVSGAIDNVEAGNLTQVVNKIKPSIPENADKETIVNETAKNNVNNTIKNILNRSEIIKELNDSGVIKIVGAFYDIETGKVTFL